MAHLAEQTGRPDTTLPTYWSPATLYFKYVSCMTPIVQPACRFVAICEGAHVDPEDIHPSAPFRKLWTPKPSILITKSFSISSLYNIPNCSILSTGLVFIFIGIPLLWSILL